MRQQIGNPLKSTIDGCPCCVTDVDQGLIRSKPLRELGREDLGKYTSKATTTWGDVDDFKHFLPRILELMVLDEYASDFALIIGKLQYADFKHWKEKEVAVVENFLMEFWSDYITRLPYSGPMEFFALVAILGDVSLLTSHWELSFDNYGFKKLIHFTQDQFLNLIKRKGEFKSWDDAQCNALMTWIFSQTKVIEEAFYRFENSGYSFTADIYTCFELLKNNADLSKAVHLLKG